MNNNFVFMRLLMFSVTVASVRWETPTSDCNLLFQRWPTQTRRRESSEDTRSSSPLRKYVLVHRCVFGFVLGRSGDVHLLFLSLPFSSTHVKLCWRSKGSMEVSISASALVSAARVGERKR